MEQKTNHIACPDDPRITAAVLALASQAFNAVAADANRARLTSGLLDEHLSPVESALAGRLGSHAIEMILRNPNMTCPGSLPERLLATPNADLLEIARRRMAVIAETVAFLRKAHHKIPDGTLARNLRQVGLRLMSLPQSTST